jgi:hypothetical protein
MSSKMISECISSLKIKNTEGYDRIPQRVLVDVSMKVFSVPTTEIPNFHGELNKETVTAKFLFDRIKIS